MNEEITFADLDLSPEVMDALKKMGVIAACRLLPARLSSQSESGASSPISSGKPYNRICYRFRT